MADKKITELTELTTTLDQDDLFVVVDNPGSATPITKSLKASTLYGGASYLTTNTLPTRILLNGIITSNGVAASSGSNTVAGKFEVNTTSYSTNTNYQYGIVGISRLNGATANVTVEHAAAKFILDVGAAAAVIANTHALIIQVTNNATRVQNTASFIGFGESSRGVTSTTTYLFDIGLNGTANVSANTSVGANSLAMVTNCTSTKTADHMIKIRVNGVDMWLLASNVAPA